MLKRPPSNRVDATPVYIHEDDDAWDRELIEAECAAMANPKDTHPWWLYVRGVTRYDLGATTLVGETPKCAADYLKPGTAPHRFLLRRLSWSEFYRVRDLWGSSNAEALACQLGLERIEGAGAPAIKRTAAGLRDSDMQALFDWDPSLPIALGNAVFLASMPLTDSEKKV